MCSGDLEEAIRKAEEERLTHLASFLAAYPICPDTNQKEMQAQVKIQILIVSKIDKKLHMFQFL